MKRLTSLSADLRDGWRALRRSPGFTAAAVLTLALGTGATLIIFSLVSGVLLAQLPYAEPDRLMHVQGSADGRYAVSMPLHRDAVAAVPSVESAAAWQGWGVIVGRPEQGLERRSGASVSWTYFDVLGVDPVAGRTFLPEDGVPGHTPVVVLGHAAWQDLFGGRREAIGAELLLDGRPHVVVGIAPEEFVDPVQAHVLGGSAPVSFWRADPPVFFDAADDSGWTAFWSVVRARPGVTAQQLRADVARAIRGRYPSWEDDGEWLRVRAFHTMATEHLSTTIAALFAAAGLVLLIACANVANLLLGRFEMRARELAVRAGLGASRGRLVRQLLAESALVAGAATALGLAAAAAALPALTALLRQDLRPGQTPGLDWAVAGFAALLILATTMTFGLLPALRASDLRLRPLLGSAGRGAPSSRDAGRTRAVLIAAEVALGVVVLVAAALLGRTLWNLRAVDPGFDADAVTAAVVSLPESYFETPDAQNAAVASLEREVAALPGVSAVGLITDLPMSGAVNSTGIARPGDAAGTRDQVLVRAVTSDFFRTMGIPLLRGRGFTDEDHARTAPVALVNRAYAARLPAGGVGWVVTVRGVPREIVGVVDDVVEFRLEAGTGDLVLYTPYPQEEEAWMRTGFYLVVRTDDVSPGALADPVRAAIGRAAPGILPVGSARPMRDLIDDDLAAHRLRAALLVLFGLTALLLAVAGIAAVVSNAVARRVHEIGIRMALGASGLQVVRNVVGSTATATAVGLALGLAAGAAVAHALSHFLFGVRPDDLAAFAGAALLLGTSAVLAAWLPARRAARVDPMVALRSQ